MRPSRVFSVVGTFLLVPLLSYAESTSSTADLVVQIQPNAVLQDPAILPASTVATLQSAGVIIRRSLSRSNTFDFRELDHGSYLLTVHCRDYTFAPLRVDVGSFITYPENPLSGSAYIDVWQTFWGHGWNSKGESRGSNPRALVVGMTADRTKDYFAERAGFSPLQFLKSPMILMAVFTLGMTFGLPYLMNSMDEETRAEFEELQSKSALGQASNPASNLQNFDFAAWMSGQAGSVSNVQDQRKPNESNRR